MTQKPITEQILATTDTIEQKSSQKSHKDETVPLALKLSLESGAREHVVASVKIENLSEDACYIHSSVILLDGFTSKKFEITGPSSIQYEGPYIKYTPSVVLLKPHSSLSNSMELSEAYDFDQAESGKYKIKFTTYTHCCHDANLKDCAGGLVELSDTVDLILI